MGRAGGDLAERARRRGGFSVVITSPADDRLLRRERAVMPTAGAQLGERPARRRGVTVERVSPAGDGPIRLKGADVRVAGRDVGVGATGPDVASLFEVAPAHQRLVRSHGAVVPGTGAHVDECPRWSCRLPLEITPPAVDGCVLLERAGVIEAERDLRVKTGGRVRLTVEAAPYAREGSAAVVGHAAQDSAKDDLIKESVRQARRGVKGVRTPAFDDAVLGPGAAVCFARGEVGECAGGGCGPAAVVVAPARDGTVGPQRARGIFAHTDLEKGPGRDGAQHSLEVVGIAGEGAPAFQRAVGAHGAIDRRIPAGADVDESAGRRLVRSTDDVCPALDGLIGSQAAGVDAPRADLQERALGGNRVGPAADGPASNSAVVPQGAAVVVADGNP